MATLTSKQKDMVCVLVAPWLPDATIDSCDIQTSCECYSEYTTDSCNIYITFEAPTDKTDKELSKIVSAIEDLVCNKIESMFEFSGCQCCSGNWDDDYSDWDGEANISRWVRVIPKRDKNV